MIYDFSIPLSKIYYFKQYRSLKLIENCKIIKKKYYYLYLLVDVSISVRYFLELLNSRIILLFSLYLLNLPLNIFIFVSKICYQYDTDSLCFSITITSISILSETTINKKTSPIIGIIYFGRNVKTSFYIGTYK